MALVCVFSDISIYSYLKINWIPFFLYLLRYIIITECILWIYVYIKRKIQDWLIYCIRFLSKFFILIVLLISVSVGLWFCSCNENKSYVIWHLGVFVYSPSKDSGQAIPRVVESCIRYINLYGELVAVQCVDILWLQWSVFKISLMNSTHKPTVTCFIWWKVTLGWFPGTNSLGVYIFFSC